MRSVQIHNGHFLTLSRGEEVTSSIQEFCESQKMHWALIQAIGAVEDVEIGYYDAPSREYVFIQDDGPFEVASLSGNVAELDEEPVVHLHAVLSRADRTLGCIGGHLRSARVSLTLEVCLWEVSQPLVREFDDETGLDLIEL